MPHHLGERDLHLLCQFADGNCSESREAFHALVRLVDQIVDELLGRVVCEIVKVERKRAFLRTIDQLCSKN
jgi:hypothetical protein